MKTLLLKTVICFSLLFITAGAASAGTGSIKLPETDLREKWLQVESPYFRITYPASLSQLSIIIAKEAEYVYKMLSAWTGYYPPKKIDILLAGNSDAANGNTKYGPHGLYITLYAVYPYSTFNMSIDEYKNWYRHLLIHEMSHYFHLNRVEGLPKIARHVLGEILYPNSATPLFVKEGFATYSETRNDSEFGRGNSPYTDMYINASIFDNDFTPLDRAANRSSVWPGSGNYYLFGVSFFNYLALQYGEDKILDFNEKSEYCAPFTWGIAFRREFGKSMHEMWDDWEGYEKNRRLPLPNSAVKKGITAFDPIGKRLGTVYSLSFDPSGKKLAYSMSTPDDTGGIYIYDFNERRNKRIKADRAAYDICFSRDGRRLYYIRMERERNVNLRKNIYSLDIRKKKEKKVTKSGAVQGFALIPDRDVPDRDVPDRDVPDRDALLVCLSTPYGTDIKLTDMEGNVLKTIATTNDLRPVILEEPSVSQDGKRIVFSGKDSDGSRILFTAYLNELLDDSLKLKIVETPVRSAYSPRWINNHEILFVGSDEGCFNLYRADADARSVDRMTNVVTGVFIPDISIDGKIAVSEYTSKGLRPVYTEMVALHDLIGGHIKPISGSVEMGAISKEKKNGVSSSTELSSPDRYRAYKYLAPGYWLPVWCSENIKLGLGFHTHGNDLLNRHQYDLSLMYDIFDSRFKNELGYTFNTDSLTFSINLFLSQELYTESFSPAFALKPAVSYPVVKSNFILKGEISAIFEDPFFGPDLGIYFSNIKIPPLWDRPKKGVTASEDIFLNRMGDPFTVLSSTFSTYYAPAQFLLLNLRLKNKTGFGEFNGYIQSGNTSTYAYIPLNGILTRGYPLPVTGTSVTDCRINAAVPLLTVYRGVYAFPLFLRSIYLNLYSDNGILFSPSSPYSFAAESIKEFTASPLQYIRSSAGAEIAVSTIIGYEFLFEIIGGYVYPFSSLGESGIYLEAGLGLTF